MERGDSEAVFAFWAPEFHSHVTARVTPDKVGSDVRGEEQKWWESARAAFPDMEFTVNLLIELDGRGHPHRGALLRRGGIRGSRGHQRHRHPAHA